MLSRRKVSWPSADRTGITIAVMSLLADSEQRLYAPADFGPSPREHASSWVFESDTPGKGGAISWIVDPA